ncbi:MAG: hypothetical protein WCL32_12075, partial [Planctomycetota bacterium]
MPSDAKFGLVVGMIVVLLIALLFFRKEGANELPAAAPTAPQPAGLRAAPNSGMRASSLCCRVWSLSMPTP